MTWDDLMREIQKMTYEQRASVILVLDETDGSVSEVTNYDISKINDGVEEGRPLLIL